MRWLNELIHYAIIVLGLVYLLPWLFSKIPIATYITKNTLAQWLITFAIYIIILWIGDKYMHRRFGIS